jgi:aspartate-semialdehyde dehydrogenase
LAILRQYINKSHIEGIMSKIRVGVLGATGMVGQRFIQLLENHPWFEVAALVGSERSAGKRYGDVAHWVLPGGVPDSVRNTVVLGEDETLDTPLIFSALPSSVATETELRLAAAGHMVCSNASSHRMAPDVPLLVPEVNPDHLDLIAVQRKNRNWSGALVTNPNCTSTPIAMSFRPLQDAIGIDKAFVVSMQALSGAGYPGVPSIDALDNVVPYIGGEEDKVETEPQKMLGIFNGQGIDDADFVTSAHCNRVAVADGHTECISLSFKRQTSVEEISELLRQWRAQPQELGLPSAPPQPVIVLDAPDRPQPRLDRELGKGMSTVVGRIRTCSILEYKFVALAHNTIRGAAGGSVLNAELMVAQGLLSR